MRGQIALSPPFLFTNDLTRSMKRETINIFRRNSVCSPRVTNTVAPELLLRQKISLPSIKSNPAVFLYCIRTRCLFIAGIITLRSNTFIVILSAIFTAVQRSEDTRCLRRLSGIGIFYS